ncbi:MAG: hypothetical protein OEV06_10310, partial [Anaerolineae bacterium]|nr:hypothetical protein [Anaerolineae bacterium]
MDKTRLVLLHEFTTTLRRKSFLFAAFGLPLLGFAIFQGIGLVNRRDPAALQSLVDAPQQTMVDGFVDHAGLIESPTDDIENG